MKTRSVICTHCRRRSDLPRKGSAWPGLPKFECPRCGTNFLYPMTNTNRVAMLLFLAGLGWAVVTITISGGTPMPGVLGVALIWGVIRDHAVGRAVREAERTEVRGGRGATPSNVGKERLRVLVRPLEDRP